MPISKIDQVDNIRVGSLLAQVAGGSNQAIAQALNLATQRGMQAERLFADQQTQFLKERSDLREFEEDQRQFGLNFDEKKRQFGLNFGEEQRQFNKQQGLREREFGERQEQNDISNGFRGDELNLSRVRHDLNDREFKFRIEERDRKLREAESGETSTSSGATRKASESEEFTSAVTGEKIDVGGDNSQRINELEQIKEVGDEQQKREANAELIKLRNQQTSQPTQATRVPDLTAPTPRVFDQDLGRAGERFASGFELPASSPALLADERPLAFEPTTAMQVSFNELGLRPDVFAVTSDLDSTDQTRVFGQIDDIATDIIDQFEKGEDAISNTDEPLGLGRVAVDSPSLLLQKRTGTDEDRQNVSGARFNNVIKRSQDRISKEADKVLKTLRSKGITNVTKKQIVDELSLYVNQRTKFEFQVKEQGRQRLQSRRLTN